MNLNSTVSLRECDTLYRDSWERIRRRTLRRPRAFAGDPPGSALVFLGLTRGVAPEMRRILARRVAINSFFVLVCSLLLGTLILQFYGISIPILRVAGGFTVAVAGWKLLNEGSQKVKETSADELSRANPLNQAFYPLTLPLATGPGTIAVVISLGLSKASYTNPVDEIIFVLASLLAVAAIAVAASTTGPLQPAMA
jgi:multiple antibiotic resistance protein